MSEIIPANKEIKAKFKPRARLLIQLGDQLIKNEKIALIELVKNSYDADANIVNVYMENADDAEAGVIIIEDDGYGMTPEIVVDVWLEPGSDFKAEKLKKQEVSPKYKRLPIGEKGIGRFGVHKLGNIIEMTTKSANADEVYVRIKWSDLNDYRYLEDVPISVYVRTTPQLFKDGKTGTNIIIRNLRETWERGLARGVKRSISALTSPFDSKDNFIPSFEIFDKPGWFEGLMDWQHIKEYSLFQFEATIENEKLINFDYNFIPWPTLSKVSGRHVSIEDKLIDTFKFIEDGDENKISLKAHKVGEVTFKGYVFDLDTYVLKLGVTDKTGFKGYLRENGGVRVFRDGLRIYDYGEPENDWLDLGLRRVNEPSKKISNNIILGAVYLSRKESTDLIEKTNREGFVENEAYKTFKEAILHVIRLVENLRFPDKRRLRSAYGPTPKSAPVAHLLEEMKGYVERRVQEEEVKKKIVDYIHKIDVDYRRVSENLLKAAGAGLSMSVVVHEVEKIISEIVKVMKSEQSSERLLNLVTHLSSLIDGYSEIIRKSSRTNENLKDILKQALFNTEFRIMSHDVVLDKNFLAFKGDPKTKVARSLLIGSLMNILDNSIYWLEKARESNLNLTKKIFIDIAEDKENHYIVIADNGTGFLIPTDDMVEPFVSAKPDGIGLGLHIASEILEAQGGRLLFPEWGDFEIPNEFKNGAIITLALKK